MPEKLPHECQVKQVNRGRITGWLASCEQCGSAFRVRFKRAWALREAREHEAMWRIRGLDETS